jgi:imidazolonepropionase-like amidohydrolase
MLTKKTIMKTFITPFVATYFILISSVSIGQAPSSLAISGANIIGTGTATLLIRDGRIDAITNQPPATDVPIVDFTDRYIVPAFIDSHVHLAIGYTAKQLVRGGIAAAVDLSSPLSYLADNYQPLNIFLSGPMITAIHGYPTQSWGADGYGLETSGVEGVRAAVDFLHASGARVIKMPVGDTTGAGAIPGMKENLSVLSKDEMKAIVDRAHQHNLPVVAHAITDKAAMRAATAGVDVLSHTPTVPLSDATIKAWSKRAVISSLAVFKNAPAALNNLRRLREAGTTILYGTDLGYAEIAGINIEELEELKKAGLDGDSILASVTETPAKFWGMEGFGHIRAGARASFLILDADPRQDLSTLTRPLAIYIDGDKVK